MSKKRKPSPATRNRRPANEQPLAKPDVKPNDVIGLELRRLLFWGVVACMVAYGLLFLMTPFGPFDDRMTRPDRFLRLDFFLRLLNVEYLGFAWFGDTNTFSWVEAMPVVKQAATIAMTAFASGFFVLRAFRVTRHLSHCECFVFSSATGFGLMSTLTLWVGLCGGLHADLTKLALLLCLFVGIFFTFCVLIYRLVKWQRGGTASIKSLSRQLIRQRFNGFVLLLALPSLLMLFFGGMLPPIDYDVTSYHAPGARHFFETGRIDFAPNNVYTNMPFGAEMFFVLGMIADGDWYVGTLVGKLIIAYCTFVAAAGVYAFGKRLHSSQAGMVGFLLYVSLPWVNWVSTAGLIDCVFGMYLLLAVFAAYLYVRSRRDDGEQRPLLYLAGVMAGCAAACKYTSVPFLVLPLCVFALYFACKQPGAARLRFDRRAAATLGLFVLSVVLACGSWYAKNLYHTGNPTYPLMYRVFGDRTGTWDAAKNERWHTAHSSTDDSVAQLGRDFKRTLFGSDWIAPVLVPLAVLPFLRRKQDRVLLALAAYIAFYLVLWWLLTHRLERFWVPILPLTALLAGIGAAVLSMGFRARIAAGNAESNANGVTGEGGNNHKPAYSAIDVNRNSGGGLGETALPLRGLPLRGAIVVCALLTFNTAYVFFPNAVSAPGKYSRFGFGVEAARVDPNRVMPLVLHFNADPPQGIILLVGDAEVFDYAVPVSYNTCFDDTPFDALFFEIERRTDNTGAAHDAAPPLRSPDEMRRRLDEAGISHIVVNWSEIERFRSRGNYGYTSDLVQPEAFERLVRLGVLRPVPRIFESPDGIPTLPGQFVYEVIGLRLPTQKGRAENDHAQKD